MSYAYEQKKRTPGQNSVQSHSGAGAAPTEKSIPNSMRLAALESGQASPTAADKGHRVDLPEAMRAKMESSFGMDFSNVKLYESKMLGETGAEAMAQGNEIAFAPGKFDVSSAEGQARLGHELSHVASQARGEVQGNGFLQDNALEERADREGAMAARGESVYGGAMAPMSSASPAAMAGPMQAKKPWGKKKKAAPEPAKPKYSDEDIAYENDKLNNAMKIFGMSKDDEGYEDAEAEYNNYVDSMASGWGGDIRSDVYNKKYQTALNTKYGSPDFEAQTKTLNRMVYMSNDIEDRKAKIAQENEEKKKQQVRKPEKKQEIQWTPGWTTLNDEDRRKYFQERAKIK